MGGIYLKDPKFQLPLLDIPKDILEDYEHRLKRYHEIHGIVLSGVYPPGIYGAGSSSSTPEGLHGED